MQRLLFKQQHHSQARSHRAEHLIQAQHDSESEEQQLVAVEQSIGQVSKTSCLENSTHLVWS